MKPHQSLPNLLYQAVTLTLSPTRPSRAQTLAKLPQECNYKFCGYKQTCDRLGTPSDFRKRERSTHQANSGGYRDPAPPGYDEPGPGGVTAQPRRLFAFIQN